MVVGPHDGIIRSGRKTRALSLCHVKTQQELVIFKLERRLSQGTKSSGTLILNFEPPKLWDVNVCCVRDFPGGPVVKILLPVQVMGLIPDWGTKIPYATWYIQDKNVCWASHLVYDIYYRVIQRNSNLIPGSQRLCFLCQPEKSELLVKHSFPSYSNVLPRPTQVFLE